MQDLESFFKTLYQNFNDRKIDLVIEHMTADVQWANGMDGGYVYGHDEVRQYWTRQFGLMSSAVTPLQIEEHNGVLKVEVRQVVHDLNSNLLADEMVMHFFSLRNGKIARFDIGDKHSGA
jgi:hypothetical protein